MSTADTLDDYGVLTEPATLKIQRLLPGPIDRVWAYLTESDLRKQWLAAGIMGMKVDTPFEFVWRNEELNSPKGKRPEGFPEEHRMKCLITEFTPPRKLAITWGENSSVTFNLEEKGNRVMLTVVHARVPDRSTLLNVSAGWHMHLSILAARLAGGEPDLFWEGWARLKKDYDGRLPA